MLLARTIPARYFTPHEANELVPTIRAYLLKVREHGREVRALERAIDEAQTAEEKSQFYDSLQRSQVAQAHLLERIVELGAELVDPLDMGRVRFPAMRNGEPVWLIWNLGESRVEKWAPISAQVFGPRPVGDASRVRWEWRN